MPFTQFKKAVLDELGEDFTELALADRREVLADIKQHHSMNFSVVASVASVTRHIKGIHS